MSDWSKRFDDFSSRIHGSKVWANDEVKHFLVQELATQRRELDREKEILDRLDGLSGIVEKALILQRREIVELLEGSPEIKVKVGGEGMFINVAQAIKKVKER